ncbi:hypothetical protein NPIL_237141 [Nephila pilipes]|uniref:Uncharacterized protein n=1 Tax=Nephila pilipes TaxID=299642 RepID=A0A8X6TQL7_NEPPI|nr:hypothetical protein NPIL_588581 [Nephila pilipes]GFT55054.1 hypothetical protein NPIL_237141 [Nephila pilipes]
MSDGPSYVFRQRRNAIRSAHNGALISSVKFDHRIGLKGSEGLRGEALFLSLGRTFFSRSAQAQFIGEFLRMDPVLANGDFNRRYSITTRVTDLAFPPHNAGL